MRFPVFCLNTECDKHVSMSADFVLKEDLTDYANLPPVMRSKEEEKNKNVGALKNGPRE